MDLYDLLQPILEMVASLVLVIFGGYVLWHNVKDAVAGRKQDNLIANGLLGLGLVALGCSFALLSVLFEILEVLRG